jgi:hypothetical protein
MIARTITGLVDKVVAAFSPQILKPLFFRPASGPTLGLEVGKDRFLKRLKIIK